MVIIDDRWVLGSLCRRTAAGPEKEEQLVYTSLASFPAEVVNPIKAKTEQNRICGLEDKKMKPERKSRKRSFRNEYHCDITLGAASTQMTCQSVTYHKRQAQH